MICPWVNRAGGVASLVQSRCDHRSSSESHGVPRVPARQSSRVVSLGKASRYLSWRGKMRNMNSEDLKR